MRFRQPLSSVDALLHLLGGLDWSQTQEILIRPAAGYLEIQTEVEPSTGEPPLDALLGEFDPVSLPSVLDPWPLIHDHCDRQNCVPCRVYCGSRAASGLGWVPGAPRVHGIPVYSSPLLEDSEFIVVLGDHWFSPVHRARGVLHGRIEEVV